MRKNMRKLNQTGFSAVEGLLSLIVAVLIVFVGYYIYHAQKNTSDTLNAASQVAQSSPAKGSTKKPASNQSSSPQYFTIKEWNIRAPYSGDLDLEYTLTSGTPEYVSFSSTQLDATDSQCKSSGNYGGIVARYLSSDQVQNEDGTSSGQTPAEYIAANNISSNKYDDIGNYYYFYSQPQGICGTSQASQDAQSQTVSAFEALFTQLKSY
jgi:hypothetical protein